METSGDNSGAVARENWLVEWPGEGDGRPEARLAQRSNRSGWTSTTLVPGGLVDGVDELDRVAALGQGRRRQRFCRMQSVNRVIIWP